jgi:hypothetical protein
MLDEETLLPPVRVLHERLTRNIRERDRLRTLLRLAVAAQQEGAATGQDPACPPARDARKGVRP